MLGAHPPQAAREQRAFAGTIPRETRLFGVGVATHAGRRPAGSVSDLDAAGAALRGLGYASDELCRARSTRNIVTTPHGICHLRTLVIELHHRIVQPADSLANSV
jgi:hypothetical protein